MLIHHNQDGVNQQKCSCLFLLFSAPRARAQGWPQCQQPPGPCCTTGTGQPRSLPEHPGAGFVPAALLSASSLAAEVLWEEPQGMVPLLGSCRASLHILTPGHCLWSIFDPAGSQTICYLLQLTGMGERGVSGFQSQPTTQHHPATQTVR